MTEADSPFYISHFSGGVPPAAERISTATITVPELSLEGQPAAQILGQHLAAAPPSLFLTFS